MGQGKAGGCFEGGQLSGLVFEWLSGCCGSFGLSVFCCWVDGFIIRSSFLSLFFFLFSFFFISLFILFFCAFTISRFPITTFVGFYVVCALGLDLLTRRIIDFSLCGQK